MIIKDGKEWTLPASELQKVKTIFGKRFPIVIKYCKNLPQSKDDDGKSYRAKSVSIPLQNVSCEEPGLIGNYTYYKTKNVVMNGDKAVTNYYPEDIDMRGSHVIATSEETTDWEFVWFLYFAHSSCYRVDKENTFANQGRALYTFDMPHREAKNLVSAAQENFRYQQIIFSKPLAELRQLAKATGKFDADKDYITLEEIQNHLLQYTTSPTGKKTLDYLVDNNHALDIYVTIQNGMHNRAIFFDVSNAKWYKTIEGSTRPSPICDVENIQDPQKSLHTFYYNNRSEYELMKQHIASVSKSQQINTPVIAPSASQAETFSKSDDNRIAVDTLVWEAKDLKIIIGGAAGVVSFGERKFKGYSELRIALNEDDVLRTELEQAYIAKISNVQ